MPKFEYRAYNKSGKTIEGVMDADHERDVLLALRRRELKAFDIKQQSASLSEKVFSFWRNKVSAQDLMRFTSMFSTLVSSGIPLSACLRTLHEQSDNPVLKKVLSEVMQEIESGLDLSAALSNHPEVFDQMYVDLVRAGEAGGALPAVLERLAVYAEKAEKLRRKVKGAMIYPAVVFGIACMIVWVILAFVVPEFAETFAQAGKALPLPTRMLIMISEGTRYYLPWMIAIGVGAYFASKSAMKDKSIMKTLDSLSLKIPLFGDLLMKASIARFSRTMSMLLSSGVPIIQAIQIVSHVAGNAKITQALLDVADAIISGETFADPLKRSDVFSPIVIQMITVGESTGNLSGMLGKIADFYEDEVEIVMDSLSSLIEPFIIVFLGVVLGFVIIALFLPILSMSELVMK